MTIVNPVDLDTITLQFGAHEGPDLADGACLLEAVAYIAGEPWSDHPDCVCPVLAAFGRAWNDALDDEARNRLLKPFIPRLIGTRSTPEVEDARAFMAADWAVRTYTPVWLRAAGLDAAAAELEALPELSSVRSCKSAMPAIAAWDAADAAGAAAWDAADAAGAAARAAAGAAARAAARDAARAAAWDAARAAARVAAWAAARVAAWAAAGAAEAATGAAVRAAAGDALRPHVELLQLSAARLFDRMIEVTA